MQQKSADNFDPRILGGSIKRNIVNPDLEEERKNCNFNKSELADYILGEDVHQEIKELVDLVKKEPSMQQALSFYEDSRSD